MSRGSQETGPGIGVQAPLPALRLGSLAVTTRECAVFGFGEVGVCYEEYRIGGRPGWSFVFERGGHDGFSPRDVALFLHVTGEVAPELKRVTEPPRGGARRLAWADG